MRDLTKWLAPAKVNLGLHVLRKREDGFHDIETVMLPIGWSDEIIVRPSVQFDFSCSDPALPTDDRNLVVRAARLLLSRVDSSPEISIHLEKRVPYGAGLGSGSSDAATTLLILAALPEIDIPETILVEVAVELGSDVPFFLQRDAAFASGRGERIAPIKTAKGVGYTMPYHMVVAVPPAFVSTADAYRLVVPNDADRPDILSVVTSDDLAMWRAHLTNDFEEPILTREPIIAKTKQALLDAGAGYAALSGSGAAVFGVFERGANAQEASRNLLKHGCRVWIEEA